MLPQEGREIMEAKARSKYEREVARIRKARIKALHMCLDIMKQEPINKTALAVYYNEYKVACRKEADLTKCFIRNPRIEKQIRALFM